MSRATQGPRVIAVGGGKGGVGKSLVAANLAVAMALAGHRTVAIDLDLGAANLHTLLGMERTSATLHDVLDGTLDGFEAAAVATPIHGLRLVAGTNGRPGAANPNGGQKARLIRQVRKLDAEVVVVDLGAGTAFNPVDFFLGADLRVLVVTPELGALQNAYGFAKAALYRDLLRLAADEHEAQLFERSRESRTRLSEVLADVAKERPALATAARRHVAAFGGCIVGNQVLEPRDVNVPRALERLLADFLGLEVPVIAGLKASRPIRDSIQRRRPFVLDGGAEESARQLHAAAKWLLEADVEALRYLRDDLDESILPTNPPSAVEVPSRLELPAPEAESHLRHEGRRQVDLPAQLLVEGAAHPARVKDLSEGGALVQAQLQLPVGGRVALLVPSLWRGGRPVEVRHADCGAFGLKFLDLPALTAAG